MGDNFYRYVNSPNETAPETLLECRRNCHLHYLWSSNLNSAASIKLHFFSPGREYAFHAHWACPSKSQTGPALSLSLIHMHASPTLCPALTEAGGERNTVPLRWKKNLFLEPSSLSAVKSACARTWHPCTCSPGPCWLEVLKSSVNNACTAPAFS